MRVAEVELRMRPNLDVNPVDRSADLRPLRVEPVLMRSGKMRVVEAQRLPDSGKPEIDCSAGLEALMEHRVALDRRRNRGDRLVTGEMAAAAIEIAVNLRAEES